MGLIRFRDRYQVEIKSEFFRLHGQKSLKYGQEIFVFIPESLYISKENYNKQQYYQDQTNLIRFKTPVFSFKELLDEQNIYSPLHRLKELLNQNEEEKTLNFVKDETTLLGNILRSALRDRVDHLQEQLGHFLSHAREKRLIEEIVELIESVQKIQAKFNQLKASCFERWGSLQVYKYFTYVDEFICRSIDLWLTRLLKAVRACHSPALEGVDKQLVDMISLQHPLQPVKKGKEKKREEQFQYERGLLNKFILTPLILQIKRESFQEKYSNLIGAIAAGIAMLIFLLGGILIFDMRPGGNSFLVQSAPIVAATTLLYVLKDRVKSAINVAYQSWSGKWFSDYTTSIYTSDEKRLGVMKESVAFLDSGSLPSEIETMRNGGFHTVLDEFKRPEFVIHHRMEVEVSSIENHKDARRKDLTSIFRLNIFNFLRKSSDVHTRYTTLDRQNNELVQLELPKTYHINVIAKNEYIGPDKEVKTEWYRYRLVVNKEGILRVEHLA